MADSKHTAIRANYTTLRDSTVKTQVGSVGLGT
jgi:hypothetical protein